MQGPTDEMDSIERVEKEGGGAGEEAEPDFDEEDVLDCTYRDQDQKIRLQNGVDIDRLMNGEGVDLIPEIDDELANGGENENQDFFKVKALSLCISNHSFSFLCYSFFFKTRKNNP